MLALPTIEYDLSVVRPCRLLSEIDMIIRKLANIDFISWKATEKILKSSEVTVVT